jgi:hypothetical protein
LIRPTQAFDSRLTASLMSWHLIATLVRNGPGVPIVSVMVDNGIVNPYRKSNPDVLMVQTSEVWGGHDTANGLHSTRRWCILVQR